MMTGNNENGFSLIEVMVALSVFAIAFLAFLMMNTTAIRGNADAYRITRAGNWAERRLEALLTMPYDAGTNGLDDDGDGVNDNNGELFDDRTADGNGGLDNVDGNEDYSLTSQDRQFTIFWNVAEDYPGNNMKTVRVIVRNRLLGTDLAFTNIKILNR